MAQLNFYETIFKRKSVRKYKLEPLASDVLGGVEEFAKKVKPIYDSIKTEIKIVSQGEVSGLLSVKAPHYLVMTSENKQGYLTNAGYMLHQMDLFLSSRGIGSCYLGLTQPTKDVKKDLELEVVMVLAFGNPEEELHRTNSSEFKRKSLSEITDINNYEEFLEPVRLAPSASNSQPWYVTGGNELFHINCVKPNFIKALVYEKLNKFDIGIALWHLSVAGEHFGRKIEFLRDEAAANNCPKGYYYTITAALK